MCAVAGGTRPGAWSAAQASLEFLLLVRSRLVTLTSAISGGVAEARASLLARSRRRPQLALERACHTCPLRRGWVVLVPASLCTHIPFPSPVQVCWAAHDDLFSARSGRETHFVPAWESRARSSESLNKQVDRTTRPRSRDVRRTTQQSTRTPPLHSFLLSPTPQSWPADPMEDDVSQDLLLFLPPCWPPHRSMMTPVQSSWSRKIQRFFSHEPPPAVFSNVQRLSEWRQFIQAALDDPVFPVALVTVRGAPFCPQRPTASATPTFRRKLPLSVSVGPRYLAANLGQGPIAHRAASLGKAAVRTTARFLLPTPSPRLAAPRSRAGPPFPLSTTRSGSSTTSAQALAARSRPSY